jgi:hypothetical protein
MNLQVLQRSEWYGEPKDLGDCFRLTKNRKVAVCRLFSHQFGWELLLETNGALQRSQVCRSQDDVFRTFEAWKAAMVEKGWA